MLLPGIKDTNVYEEWPTSGQINPPPPPPPPLTVLQHAVHHWKALCENLPAGSVKIKLGQPFQIRQTYAIQTLNIDQSEIPALILIATKYLPSNWLKKKLREITSLLPVIVFILAMETMTCFSAEYLQIREFTSCRSAVWSWITSFLMDYFLSDGSDPEWSDDECLSEPDVEIYSLCVFHCSFCTELD